MESIGTRLRKARQKKRFTQVDVFKKTGINNKTLSRYENDGTEPDADSLKRLADLYEVTTDWIISGKQKESHFALPESVYEDIIKETEAKYGVTLRDDPFVVETMKQIIDSYAKSKLKNNQ